MNGAAPCPVVRVEMRAFCRFCRREWESWLRAMLERAAELAMLPGQGCGPRGKERARAHGEPSLVLIVAGDGAIAEVNARNLGCHGPTNILSFPGEEGEPGTLFLSADTLERESLLYGQDAPVHARRLLAHGTGHILGFDHGQTMDEFCAELERACA